MESPGKKVIEDPGDEGFPYSRISLATSSLSSLMSFATLRGRAASVGEWMSFPRFNVESKESSGIALSPPETAEKIE